LLGALLLLAAVIMVVDPQWSFTQLWQIDAFRRINWDVVWPWALVVAGGALLVLAAVERSAGTAIPGAFLVVTGAVFVLGVSWDVVWPLVLVAVGAIVLASLVLRRTTTV
jgi:cell division protein FtsW (lipid II flippase)